MSRRVSKERRLQRIATAHAQIEAARQRRNAEVLAARNEGVTYREMAERMGVTKWAIVKMLNNAEANGDDEDARADAAV